MGLGEKISSIRKSKGISQELLAENSRVSLRTVQRIEAGVSSPRPYTVKVIADALGVDVEQLNSIESGEADLDQIKDGLEILRLINLSALVVLIIPFSNIILPVMIWKRNRNLLLVDEIGRKIISFQILWTVGTFLMTLLIHTVLNSLTQSVRFGHLPPTIFLIYFTALSINFLIIIRSAIQLRKSGTAIYSFVPGLF